MQLIAPAPSGSPSVSPSPTPAPAATTASVGTPSPLPVNVIDDPDADGVEIAGLVFAILAFVVGAVASAFSIVLAQRAVRIGEQANAAAVKAAEEAERANEEASKARAAVAAERRRTFELEVLRDLAERLDGQRQMIADLAKRPAVLDFYFGSSLRMLPESDLPFWRELPGIAARDLPEKLGGRTELDEQQIRQADLINIYSPSGATIDRLKERLRADVLDAIARRMDARDD